MCAIRGALLPHRGPDMKITAFEGPSYAGKTTAIASIASHDPQTAVFDCYVRGLSRQDVPPARTRTRDEQLAAFELFMCVERERVRRISDMADSGSLPTLVILDRSVDTLLAHAQALDTLFGMDVRDAIAKRVAELPYLVPDLTLYLDVDASTLQARRAAGGSAGDYFLHEPQFLGPWRDYFSGNGPKVTRRIEWIDAAGLLPEVTKSIRSLL